MKPAFGAFVNIRRRALRPLSVALAVIAGLMACSSLPEYAAPRARAADSKAAGGDLDLIAYRKLSRSDFRAVAPPPEAAAHAEKLGALTCAHITTTPDTSYEIQEIPRGNKRRYTVRFNRLGFVALMDRACSWWNDNNRPEDVAYVLQHEQIHFALAEVEARRCNREAERLLKSWKQETSSMEAAKSLVEERLRSLVDDAMADLLDVSRDFDKDTSLKYLPERQNEWERRTDRELAELARYQLP